MTIQIRSFKESDIDELVEILQLNGQYDYPEVEGPQAMKRVAKCEAAVFLVAEQDAKPCGLIRGIYDGARALIHLLSVHPEHQRSGIGTQLVEAIKQEFIRRGASGTTVTVSEKTTSFWEKTGFRRVPVFLRLNNFDATEL